MGLGGLFFCCVFSLFFFCYTFGAKFCMVLKYVADFQQWRLVCLAVGLILLLLAPIVSSWVPFYYSTSMAIGIFLVIIILLFQVCNYINYSHIIFEFHFMLPNFP